MTNQKELPMDHIITEDGKTVRKGDRAFNYYDGYWVTVGDIDSEGWADCQGPARCCCLNGARLASYDPNGSKDPGVQG